MGGLLSTDLGELDPGMQIEGDEDLEGVIVAHNSDKDATSGYDSVFKLWLFSLAVVIGM